MLHLFHTSPHTIPLCPTTVKRVIKKIKKKFKKFPAPECPCGRIHTNQLRNGGIMTTRRSFIAASTAFAAAGISSEGRSATQAETEKRGIHVRFLGSGAAGWQKEWAQNPHHRRPSSVLLDGKALIDFTNCAFDMLPAGAKPEVLFQTHSHGDHYNPYAAVKSGVRRMYGVSPAICFIYAISAAQSSSSGLLSVTVLPFLKRIFFS